MDVGIIADGGNTSSPGLARSLSTGQALRGDYFVSMLLSLMLPGAHHLRIKGLEWMRNGRICLRSNSIRPTPLRLSVAVNTFPHDGSKTS